MPCSRPGTTRSGATGASFIRWVDDVAIFAPDRRATGSGARRASERRGHRSVWRCTSGRPVVLDDPRDIWRRRSEPVSNMRPRDLHAAIIAPREDPLPRRPRAHALVPADRRVGPGGRPARAAGRQRGPARPRIGSSSSRGRPSSPGFVDTHVHLTPTGIPRWPTSRWSRAGDARDLLADRRGPGPPTGTGACGSARLRRDALDRSHAARPGGARRRDGPAARDLWRTDGHISLCEHGRDRGGRLSARTSTARSATSQGAFHGSRADGGERPAAPMVLAQALDDREIQELQLRAAGVAASRGITSITRDVDARRPRAPRPGDPPGPPEPAAGGRRSRGCHDGRAADHGSAVSTRSAAICRWTAPWALAPRPVTSPYVDGPGWAPPYYEDEELERFFLSGHAAGLQVGITRSATARSSRCCRPGNGSTPRWTDGGAGISGLAGTASSTSRW